MNTITHTGKQTPETESRAYPPGHGYLLFASALQIGVGIFSILFSLFGFSRSLAADEWIWFERAYATGHSFFERFVNHYVSFHIAFGWLLGGLLIVGGILSCKRRHRGAIQAISTVNLLNFPHGTTAAIMTLHGLAQSRVRAAFSEQSLQRTTSNRTS